MMETAQEKKDWGLVHTPNGEWIYEYNAVCLSDVEAAVFDVLARQQGKKFTVWQESKKEFLCYRHEFEVIEIPNWNVHQYELKITKKPKHNEL